MTGVDGLDIAVLSAGDCTIHADQPGDAQYAAAARVSRTFTVNPASSSTVVESDNNPSVFGENVTFTATVSSGAGVPTGSVLFTVDGTPQVSATPLVNGVASLSTSALTWLGARTRSTVDYTSDTGDWSPSCGFGDGPDGDGVGQLDGGRRRTTTRRCSVRT